MATNEFMLETCKICGKEWKNLAAHVRGKHHMSMEEYKKAAIVDDFAEMEEENTVKASIIETDLMGDLTEEENIVDSSTIEEDTKPVVAHMNVQLTENSTIIDLMNRYDISFSELLKIFDEYKSGRTKKVMKTIEVNQTFGDKEAKKLKGKERVETHDLHTAEALVVNHGYKCLTVRRGPPKTWVLEK